MELGRIQTRWVEALESGRYKQYTYGRLRKGDKFCCLGVACDLYDPTNWAQVEPFHPGENCDLYRYDSESMELPLRIVEWLELNGSQGEPVGSSREDSLVNLNDSDVSFREIAKTLRERPERYFIRSV